MVGAAVEKFIEDTDDSLRCSEIGGDDVQFCWAPGAPDRRSVASGLFVFMHKADPMMGAGRAQPPTTTWAEALENMSSGRARTLKHDEATQLSAFGF